MLMKQIYRRLTAMLLLIVVLITASAISVSAEVPYDSYTYWTDVDAKNKAVYNRQMYDAVMSIDASTIGVQPFNKVMNICTDNSGNLFVLDSASRIIMLDSEFKFVREIGLIGGTESYNNASGLYAHTDGTLYLCDTEGHRVLRITNEGQLIETIGLPESSLIPKEFDFRPTSVVVDSHGHIYILSDGSYYGALLYDEDKNFLGFYGANTVTTNIADVFTNIKNRIFPNNDKKQNTAQRLPYCFVDIEIDDLGFIYTSNGYTEKYSNKGQIRRLSPGTGNNILGSDDVNFVDANVNTTYKDGAMSKQDIIDIAVDSNGFVYGLESAFGRIFMYDSDSRIITAFGGGMGMGDQIGNFVTVSGMALKQDGGQVLVSDSETNLVTVFSLNEYGSKVKKLIGLTLQGNYDQTKKGWEEILKQDSNFQPAYSGLALSYLNEGNYKAAMEYAKIGYDRDTYALALEYQRRITLNENFVWIFVILVAVIGLFIAFMVISTKKKLVLVKNQQLRFLFSTAIHPANNFTDLKEKGKGSILVCVVLVILFYVVTVLKTLKGGFLFTVYDVATFNSLWVLVRSAGLVILWIVANWMVCTLLGGKGKIREICIVTCYSLLPLIVEKILYIILSNALLPSEASFLNIISAISIIYFGIMMVIGLQKVHDFSFARLVGTSALSALGIAAIVFLLVMVIILVQQCYGFLVTVAGELLTL